MLGSVMLCVTGAEALYADLGHFTHRSVLVGVAGCMAGGRGSEASAGSTTWEPSTHAPLYMHQHTSLSHMRTRMHTHLPHPCIAHIHLSRPPNPTPPRVPPLRYAGRLLPFRVPVPGADVCGSGRLPHVAAGGRVRHLLEVCAQVSASESRARHYCCCMTLAPAGSLRRFDTDGPLARCWKCPPRP